MRLAAWNVETLLEISAGKR